MAAPADYLDASDLKAVAAGGVIREDAADTIFDTSDIPTPFLDLIGTGASFSNPYSDWTEDKLATPNLANKVVSGSDYSSANNTASVANRRRVGNHGQISTKGISVSQRAQAVDVIGVDDELGYQSARKLIELRYDVEAISLHIQGSVEDNGNNTAGESAGLAAWVVTNDSGGTDFAATGFNTTTKLVADVTPGDGRAGTFDMVATQIENTYILGANTTVLMSLPQITKRFARYLFTTTFAAAPTANIQGSGGGVNQTSQGYIDMFRTDFGTTMEIVPNRHMQPYASGDTVPVDVGNVFGIDPRFLEVATLYGWLLDALGKKGLSIEKLWSVDWMLRCKLERAQFVVRDILPTGTWTAS